MYRGSQLNFICVEMQVVNTKFYKNRFLRLTQDTQHWLTLSMENNVATTEMS